MTNTNAFFLVGNVTREIGENDFSYISTGSARLNFSIAVNRSKKVGEEWIDEVSYFEILCWGKMAENLKRLITKGQKVICQGYLKQDRWTDSEGNKKSKYVFVAERVELAGGKSENKPDANPTVQPLKETPSNDDVNDGYVVAEDIPF